VDGETAKTLMLDHANEADARDAYLTDRKIYQYLDLSALDFVRQTRCIHDSVDITTVEDQQVYDLPWDWLEPWIKSPRSQRFVGKYVDSDGNTTWPVLTAWAKIFRANRTDSEETPGSFCIKDNATTPAQISGVTTAAGAATGGQCTLTASAATFVGSVNPRDRVHNEADGSSGMILSVTGNTALVTALFGGTDNDWTSGDAYRITPEPLFQVMLRAPSENAGDTLTLEYVAKPEPMFSERSRWRFPERVCLAICKEAAGLFMDTQREFDVAKAMHAEFEREIRQFKLERAREILQGGRYTTRR